MAETKSKRLRWVAGIGGLAAVAVGISVAGGLAAIAVILWVASGDSAERKEADGSGPALNAAADPALSPAAPAAAVPKLRIAANGRLTLELDQLPDEGPLELGLDLSEEARGSGDRTVRVISVDGRRLDTTASPLPGRESGVRLEIDPAFLSAGRYLIEIDTEEKHPLQLRRYVLELRRAQ